MKIIRSTILKRITTFALLLAMVAGMATTLGRKADAGSIPNGYNRITLKCFNKTQTKTVDVLAGQYSNYKLPQQTSDQYGSFINWKRESDGKTFSAGTTVPINGHTTFIAVWSTVAVFHDYDGRVIKNVSVTTGQAYGKNGFPANPTRSGYKFIGWYYGNQKITSSTVCMTGTRHDVTARYEITLKGACDKIDTLLWGVNSANGIAKYKSNITRGGGYIYQHEHYNGGGICTSCAIANLLNRRLVYNTNSNKNVFNYYTDVLPVMYYATKGTVEVYAPSSNGYRVKFTKGRDGYNEERSFTAAGKSYTTTITSDIRNKKTDKEKAAYLASMLDAHKEGVVLWTRGHAMVITYYEKDSSAEVGYKFYAVDTGGSVGSYEKGSYDYNSYCPIEYAFNFTDKNHGDHSMARLLNDSKAYIIYIK